MSYRLMFAGLATVAAGVAYVVNVVDRSVNYQTVQARVDSMSSTCFLEKRERKRREWTDSRPCDVIEKAKADDKQYASFEIKRETTAHFRYVSPVDGKEHLGELTDNTTNSEAPFKGIGEGGLLPILAHSTDAEKFQKL